MNFPRQFLSFLFLALVTAVAADPAAQPAGSVASNGLRESILRVASTNQAYDFFQPWVKKESVNRRGVGALIEGGRILVTAELVENSNLIELEKVDAPGKATARIELVDFDCNLALLRPENPAFLNGMKPLRLVECAGAGDQATVVQVEPNGQLAKTTGRITSATIEGYPFLSLGLLVFKLSAPLQQRDWSFTLPVVRDGGLCGLLMRYDSRNQASDVIPPPVIAHFLREASSGDYKGFARLGVFFSTLRDPQLRRYLGLESGGGIYVTQVVPGSAADKGGLKKGDVILSVNGHKLDQDGNYEDPEFGRILFSHLTNTRMHPGEVCEIGVFRDRRAQTFHLRTEVPNEEMRSSEGHSGGRTPKYVILGGLVFLELSRDYLREWGGNWQEKAPQRLVYLDFFQDELPADRGKIVILSQVLPSPGTIGYEHLENLVVTRVNGRPIKSLNDLSAAAAAPRTDFKKSSSRKIPRQSSWMRPISRRPTLNWRNNTGCHRCNACEPVLSLFPSCHGPGGLRRDSPCGYLAGGLFRLPSYPS